MRRLFREGTDKNAAFRDESAFWRLANSNMIGVLGEYATESRGLH